MDIIMIITLAASVATPGPGVTKGNVTGLFRVSVGATVHTVMVFQGTMNRGDLQVERGASEGLDEVD
jgi:hypothetical protein